MKKIVLILLIIVLPIAVYAGTGHSKFTQHYKDSVFKITENSLYSVELVIKDHILKVGINTIDVIIHDKNDRDVVDAEITVTPWMPDMGHGVSEKAIITEKGGGLYVAENVVFNMSGKWELKINVKKDETEDTVIFEFTDIGSDQKQEMHPAHESASSVTESSLTELSEGKLFSVTYESQLEPITVNKIHGVKLKVETADGKPVSGAEIEIKGDMPAHGHGLPTEPEVTQELGDGYYLVEGMKFSMPGHWVITFEIEAEDKEDTVIFDLNLK